MFIWEKGTIEFSYEYSSICKMISTARTTSWAPENTRNHEVWFVYWRNTLKSRLYINSVILTYVQNTRSFFVLRDWATRKNSSHTRYSFLNKTSLTIQNFHTVVKIKKYIYPFNGVYKLDHKTSMTKAQHWRVKQI